MSIVRDNVENWRDLPQPPSLEAGTTITVVQSSAPTGWILNTSLNDRVIRIVSGTGGGVGGTWDLTGVATGGHVLTIDEMPSHDHDVYISVTADGDRSMPFGGAEVIDTSDPTTSTGGNASHSHPISSDNTWRPAYVDAIIVTRI